LPHGLKIRKNLHGKWYRFDALRILLRLRWWKSWLILHHLGECKWGNCFHKWEFHFTLKGKILCIFRHW
jgi:hypothetical protein